MKEKTAQLSIENFGPHKSGEWTIPLDSPVVVLNGPNGAGKGFFQRVLFRTLGDTNIKPELADGAKEAFAQLTVGDQSIGLTLKDKYGRSDADDFPIRLAIGEGEALAKLIGPVGDDESREKKSEKARLEALSSLLGIEVTAELAERLADGHLDDPPLRKTLLETDGAIKRAIDQKAYAIELQAKVETGRLIEVKNNLSELEMPPEHVLMADLPGWGEMLKNAYSALSNQIGELRLRQQMERAQEQARKDLTEPDPYPVRAALYKASKFALEDTLPYLQIKTSISLATAELERFKASRDSYKEAQAILARPIEGATIKSVDWMRSFCKTVDETLDGLSDAADMATKIFDLQARKTTLAEAVNKLTIEAKTLRAAAKSVRDRTIAELKKCGLSVLRIGKKNVLESQVAGKWRALGALSLGERSSAALDAWLEVAKLKDGEICFVPFSPAHWGSMDTDARQSLVWGAEEHKGRVVILTEQPGPGEDGEFVIKGLE